MTKYFKSVSTQLEMTTYNKLIKICSKEGCKPYAILKSLLIDYIDSYPETPKEGEEKSVKPRMGEVEEGDNRGTEKDQGLPFLKSKD